MSNCHFLRSDKATVKLFQRTTLVNTLYFKMATFNRGIFQKDYFPLLPETGRDFSLIFTREHGAIPGGKTQKSVGLH